MLRVSELMVEVLLNLPSGARGIDGRMRLVDLRRFLNNMLHLNLSREYSRQAVNELVRRGLVDFIIIKGRRRNGDETLGIKWFGLTPMGVLRTGVYAKDVMN